MVLLQIAPFLLMLTLYAAYLKLAARILKRGSVLWRHCFLFALIIGALTIGGRALSFYGGISLPPLLAMIVALAAQIAFGAWFFGSKGITPQGHALGWRGGALLSVVALVLLIGTAGVLAGVFFGLARVLQP